MTLVLGDGSLQLQAFAAPRTDGIWDEIRDEIRAVITRQGGIADDVPGAVRPRAAGPSAGAAPGRQSGHAARPVPRRRTARAGSCAACSPAGRPPSRRRGRLESAVPRPRRGPRPEPDGAARPAPAGLPEPARQDGRAAAPTRPADDDRADLEARSRAVRRSPRSTDRALRRRSDGQVGHTLEHGCPTACCAEPCPGSRLGEGARGAELQKAASSWARPRGRAAAPRAGQGRRHAALRDAAAARGRAHPGGGALRRHRLAQPRLAGPAPDRRHRARPVARRRRPGVRDGERRTCSTRATSCARPGPSDEPQAHRRAPHPACATPSADEGRPDPGRRPAGAMRDRRAGLRACSRGARRPPRPGRGRRPDHRVHLDLRDQPRAAALARRRHRPRGRCCSSCGSCSARRCSPLSAACSASASPRLRRPGPARRRTSSCPASSQRRLRRGALPRSWCAGRWSATDRLVTGDATAWRPRPGSPSCAADSPGSWSCRSQCGSRCSCRSTWRRQGRLAGRHQARTRLAAEGRRGGPGHAGARSSLLGPRTGRRA